MFTSKHDRDTLQTPEGYKAHLEQAKQAEIRNAVASLKRIRVAYGEGYFRAVIEAAEAE